MSKKIGQSTSLTMAESVRRLRLIIRYCSEAERGGVAAAIEIFYQRAKARVPARRKPQ